MTQSYHLNRLLTRLLRGRAIPQKLSADVLWNIGSFGIMGGIGLLLNVVIAAAYNAGALGAFNQVYAIYILLSQFAAGGVHLSVLKSISQFSSDSSQRGEIYSAGLLLAAALSGVVTLLGWGFADGLGRLLDSPAVSEGLCFALPGLFLFSLNKVILSFMNGCRHMRAFAVFQGMRFVLMLIWLVVLAGMGTPGSRLPVLLSLSEALLFLLLFPYSLGICRLRFSAGMRRWIKGHFLFGLRAAGGNILLDITTRVDVLTLGYFTSDKVVGVYSLGALFAEGFAQSTMVLRVNVNPVITQTFYSRGKKALEEAVKDGRRLSYILLTPLGLAAVLAYPLILSVFNLGPDFSASWGVFAVLMTGILLSAGYLPFIMLLNQTGCPGYQTLLSAIFFMTNVVFNVGLIPFLGMYGAALGTAMALGCQVFYLRYLVRRAVGIGI